MTEQLLTFLLDYGVFALVPVLLAAAIGIPLPGTLLLVAAGAFTSGGFLDLLPLLIGAVGATVAGNEIGYQIGQRGGTRALSHWGRRFHIGDETIARADSFFNKYGTYSVVLSRFPFSPLSAVINILAGTASYSPRAFLFANLLGVTVWAGVYLGLGYAFAASWDTIASILGQGSQVLTLGLVVVVLAVLLVRALRHRHDHDDEANATEQSTDPAHTATPTIKPSESKG